MGKKRTLKEFIKLAQDVHSNIYDYSDVKYKNCKIKINIICLEHGIFEQTPDSHLRGHGCPKCANKNNHEDIVQLSKKFIEKSNEKHNYSYDYSKINYKNAKTKIKILCKVHGFFWQTPDSHVRGNGCKKCFDDKKKYLYNFNTEFFIEKSKKIHGDLYNYDNVDYSNNRTKVVIICKIHGQFKKRPEKHLRGSGCPKCKSSRGEQTIITCLDELNIQYFHKFKFNDCKFKRLLEFDFYLPKYNIIIEYNGLQHYENVNWSGKLTNEQMNDMLKINKARDNVKLEYCKENDLLLLNISYLDLEYIKYIITHKINDMEKNINKRIYLETTDALNRIENSNIKSIVTVYGSARLTKESKEYKDAETFARLLSHITNSNEYILATGGGPSIMEAVNKGSYLTSKQSIGYGIELEFETELNKYISKDLRFHFNYFSSRKVLLLKRCVAIVVFPGGLGTLDELFNSLTLISTKKIKKIPILLYDQEFWYKLIDFDYLLKKQVISKSDLDLITYCNTPQELVDNILK